MSPLQAVTILLGLCTVAAWYNVRRYDHFYKTHCSLYDNLQLNEVAQDITGTCDDPLSRSNKIAIQGSAVVRFNHTQFVTPLCLEWIVWPDSNGHMRWTNVVAGDRNSHGHVDGRSISARFNYPRACTSHPGNPTIFIADKWNGAVRTIDLLDRMVSTLAVSSNTPFSPHDLVWFGGTSLFVFAMINSTIPVLLEFDIDLEENLGNVSRMIQHEGLYVGLGQGETIDKMWTLSINASNETTTVYLKLGIPSISQSDNVSTSSPLTSQSELSTSATLSSQSDNVSTSSPLTSQPELSTSATLSSQSDKTNLSNTGIPPINQSLICTFEADIESETDNLFVFPGYNIRIFSYHNKLIYIARNGFGVINPVTCTIDYIGLPVSADTPLNITFHTSVGEELLLYVLDLGSYLISEVISQSSSIKLHPTNADITVADFGLNRARYIDDNSKYGYGTVQSICRHPYEEHSVLLIKDNQVMRATQIRDRTDIYINDYNQFGHLDGSFSEARFGFPSSCTSLHGYDIVLVADTGNQALRALLIEERQVRTCAPSTANLTTITRENETLSTRFPAAPRLVQYYNRTLIFVLDITGAMWYLTDTEVTRYITANPVVAMGTGDSSDPADSFIFFYITKKNTYRLKLRAREIQCCRGSLDRKVGAFNIASNVDEYTDGGQSEASLLIKGGSRIIYKYGYYFISSVEGSILTLYNSSSFVSLPVGNQTDLATIYDIIPFSHGRLLAAGAQTLQLIEFQNEILQPISTDSAPQLTNAYWMPTVHYQAADYRNREGMNMAGICSHPWFPNQIMVVAENAIYHRYHYSHWNSKLLAGTPHQRGFHDGNVSVSLFRSPSDCASLPLHELVYISDTGNDAVRVYSLVSKETTTLLEDIYQPRSMELLSVTTLAVQHSVDILSVFNVGEIPHHEIVAYSPIRWWIPYNDAGNFFLFQLDSTAAPTTASIIRVSNYTVEEEIDVIQLSELDSVLDDDSSNYTIADTTDPNIHLKGWLVRDDVNQIEYLASLTRQGTLLSLYGIDTQIRVTSFGTGDPIRDLQFNGDHAYVGITQLNFAIAYNDHLFRNHRFPSSLTKVTSDERFYGDVQHVNTWNVGSIQAICPHPLMLKTDILVLLTSIQLAYPPHVYEYMAGSNIMGDQGDGSEDKNLWTFNQPTSCASHPSTDLILIADTGNSRIRGFHLNNWQTSTLETIWSDSDFVDPYCVNFIDERTFIFVAYNSTRDMWCLVLKVIDGSSHLKYIWPASRISHCGVALDGSIWLMASYSTQQTHLLKEAPPLLASTDWDIVASYNLSRNYLDVANGPASDTLLYLPKTYQVQDIIEQAEKLYMITSAGQYITVVSTSDYSTSTLHTNRPYPFSSLKKTPQGKLLVADTWLNFAIERPQDEEFVFPNYSISLNHEPDMTMQTVNYWSDENPHHPSAFMYQATSLCTSPLQEETVYTTHGCALVEHTALVRTNRNPYIIGDLTACGHQLCIESNRTACRFLSIDSCVGHSETLSVYIADTGNHAIRYLKFYQAWTVKTLMSSNPNHNADLLLNETIRPTALTQRDANTLLYIEMGTTRIYQINLLNLSLSLLANQPESGRILCYGVDPMMDRLLVLHETDANSVANVTSIGSTSKVFQQIKLAEASQALRAGPAEEAVIQSNEQPGLLVTSGEWYIFLISNGHVVVSYSLVSNEIALTESPDRLLAVTPSHAGKLFALTAVHTISEILFNGLPGGFEESVAAPGIRPSPTSETSAVLAMISGVCPVPWSSPNLMVTQGHAVGIFNQGWRFGHLFIPALQDAGRSYTELIAIKQEFAEIRHGYVNHYHHYFVRFTHPTSCTVLNNQVIVVDTGNFKLRAISSNSQVDDFILSGLDISSSRIHSLQSWGSKLVFIMSLGSAGEQIVIYDTNDDRATFIGSLTDTDTAFGIGRDQTAAMRVYQPPSVGSSDPVLKMQWFTTGPNYSDYATFAVADNFRDTKAGLKEESRIMPATRQKVIELEDYWILVTDQGWSLTAVYKLDQSTQVFRGSFDHPIVDVMYNSDNSVLVAYGSEIRELFVQPLRHLRVENSAVKAEFLQEVSGGYCAGLDVLETRVTESIDMCAFFCYKSSTCTYLNYHTDTGLCEMMKWGIVSPETKQLASCLRIR